MGFNFNGHFSPKQIPMAKNMKRCSKSFVTGERQIKTTVRYHFTTTKMVIVKKKKKTINFS